MAHLYLGLGTNLGDREKNMYSAVRMIEERIGHVTALSSFISTVPWGFSSENNFLNAALCAVTDFEPDEVLSLINGIERDMGRRLKSVDGIYHDRIIDIDILFYDDRIIKKDNLVIPHPLMHKRDFVMKPLSEIAPGKIHPVFGKTVGELLDDMQFL